MEISFNQEILDLDKKPLGAMETIDKEKLMGVLAAAFGPEVASNIMKSDIYGKDILTLRRVAGIALSFPDKNATGDEFFNKWKLWKLIDCDTDPVTITIDEAVLLKKAIANRYKTALISGQAWDMIENAN